jgi:hypothetical protein
MLSHSFSLMALWFDNVKTNVSNVKNDEISHLEQSTIPPFSS